MTHRFGDDNSNKKSITGILLPQNVLNGTK